jgi:hypothetical protein
MVNRAVEATPIFSRRKGASPRRHCGKIAVRLTKA